MIQDKTPLRISGICDVCNLAFDRPKLRTEKANGWPTRLTDETAPVKVVCGKSACVDTRKRMNKKHANKKTNTIHKDRNTNRNFAVQKLYAEVDERFKQLAFNNTFYYRILRGISAKAIRDKNDRDATLRLFFNFTDPSVNKQIDYEFRVIIGFMQSWYEFLKRRGYKPNEIFRQSNPVKIEGKLKTEIENIDDEEIDIVYNWLVCGTVSTEEFVEYYSKKGVVLSYQNDTLYEIDFDDDDYTFTFTYLFATKRDVGKSFCLNTDYDLVELDVSKERFSQHFDAKTVQLNGLEKFTKFLNKCTPRDAALYGVLKDGLSEFTLILAKNETLKGIEEKSQYSRSKRNFYFSTDKGILCLDFDNVDSIEQALSDLFKCVPILKRFSYVVQPSSSSNIYKGLNPVSTKVGFHVYFLLDDASRAPLIADIIFKRSILNDMGKVEISDKFNSKVRGLIDKVVVSPERADFVAKSTLRNGLSQDRTAYYVKGDSEVVTTALIKPLSALETALYKEKATRLSGISKPAVSARKSVSLSSAYMTHDQVIVTSKGHTITVQDVLDNEQTYKNMSVQCPITKKNGKSKIFVNNDGSIVLTTFGADGHTWVLRGNNVNQFKPVEVKDIPVPEKFKPSNVQKRSGSTRILS